MKRTIVSLLFLTVLAGCSRNDSEGILSGEDVPVVLSAGMPAAPVLNSNRASVETGGTFTAGIGGWETSGTVDYTLAASWYTTGENIVANPATPQPVILTDRQVYHADKAVKTYMKAWYPAGQSADGKVTFDNRDGTVDAMLAPQVAGSKHDNAGKVLTFRHRTTQVKFEVKADLGLASGTVLKKISVQGAELPTGFDLGRDAVVYAPAAELEIPGISGAVIGKKAVPVGSPVMVRPMKGNTVRLDIETSTATFENVIATIDDDSDFAEGKAYTITLTFRQKDVALAATVAEWGAGSGSATVE